MARRANKLGFVRMPSSSSEDAEFELNTVAAFICNNHTMCEINSAFKFLILLYHMNSLRVNNTGQLYIPVPAIL